MAKSAGRVFKFGSDANIEKRTNVRKLIRAMVHCESENVLQDGFIDLLYGAESALERELFIKLMKDEKVAWIFESDKIRARFDKNYNTPDNKELLEDEYYSGENKSTSLAKTYGHETNDVGVKGDDE